MKQAWLEISEMLGEPTEEDFDVFLRTWQRASQATRKGLTEQSAQRTWVGLTDEDMHDPKTHNFDFIHGARWAEAKLKEKNT